MTPENEKEHAEQIIQDKKLENECQLCEELVAEKLVPMLYSDGDKLMVCQKCWSQEADRGDLEYERWKDQEDEDDREERA